MISLKKRPIHVTLFLSFVVGFVPSLVIAHENFTQKMNEVSDSVEGKVTGVREIKNTVETTTNSTTKKKSNKYRPKMYRKVYGSLLFISGIIGIAGALYCLRPFIAFALCSLGFYPFCYSIPFSLSGMLAFSGIAISLPLCVSVAGVINLL